MRETDHIRTFEYSGNWESLKKAWDSYLPRIVKNSDAGKLFNERILMARASRELNINETRGIKCLRAGYDAVDAMLWVKVFDETGYIDLELALDIAPQEGDDNDGTGSENLYVNEFEQELLDAPKIIAAKPANSAELILQSNGRVMHFREIPACAWDIYMRDPVWLFYTATGEEGILYRSGFKLTEVTHKDVDGIVAGSRHMYYNRNGMLQRRVYMCGTPWGGVLPYDEEIWNYDTNNNIATMTEIMVRKNTVLNYHEYKTDEHGNIAERRDFRPIKMLGAMAGDEKISGDLAHWRTLYYEFNSQDQLITVTTRYCRQCHGNERVEYEYDDLGRLILQRDYNESGELVCDDQYNYHGVTKVHCRSRIFMNADKGNADPAASKGGV